MNKSAVLSEDRVYRYSLARWWDEALPKVLFVGLNPSTADASIDDPTIRKCIGYARRWGYGGFLMANLFAFRSSRPMEMKNAREPIGPDNNAYLRAAVDQTAITVCAWGTHGAFRDRDAAVLKLLNEKRGVYCLRTTKAGHPEHPLYLPGELMPRVYDPPKRS